MLVYLCLLCYITQIYIYIHIHIYIYVILAYPLLGFKAIQNGLRGPFFHLAFFCEKGGVAEGMELLLEKQFAF